MRAGPRAVAHVRAVAWSWSRSRSSNWSPSRSRTSSKTPSGARAGRPWSSTTGGRNEPTRARVACGGRLVVAAFATSAPPATRPVVNAPIANTLRSRICMAVVPFRLCGCAGPFGPVLHTVRPGSVAQRADNVGASGGVSRRMGDDSQRLARAPGGRALHRVLDGGCTAAAKPATGVSGLGRPPAVGAHGDIDHVEPDEEFLRVQDSAHRLEMRARGRRPPW